MRKEKDSLHPAVKEAIHFLKVTLFELTQSTWAKLTELAAEDIAEITLRRARAELELTKTFAAHGQCLWSLPRRLYSEMVGQLYLRQGDRQMEKRPDKG
jgi:hypothetical protein